MSLFELVTMYMKKLRASDRLKKQVHFSWNTSAELEHECKLQITRTAKVSPLLTLWGVYRLVQLCCL